MLVLRFWCVHQANTLHKHFWTLKQSQEGSQWAAPRLWQMRGGVAGKEISNAWHLVIKSENVCLWCLKPHIGGSSCTKHVVIQVHNYTHTHTQTRKFSPFKISFTQGQSESRRNQQTCFSQLFGTSGMGSLGSHSVSFPPNTGLSALVLSVRRGNWGNSTFRKMTTTVDERKECWECGRSF